MKRTAFLLQLADAAEALQVILRIERRMDYHKDEIVEPLRVPDAEQISKALRTVAQALDAVLTVNQIPDDAGCFEDLANETGALLTDLASCESARRAEAAEQNSTERDRD